jgi:hypothetical protein
MKTAKQPRDFADWRERQFDRQEDAAYLFGYYLVMNCRDEAMSSLPANAPTEAKAAVEKAVDTALHNVCAMLEGFWRLDAGPDHAISLALGVQVRNAQNEVIETQEISPCTLDLQIGYWKWAQDREFR